MFKVLVALVLVSICSADYTKLQWSTSCGTGIIKFYSLDVTPMPIRHPGPAKLILVGENTRAITGKVKSDINIVRTVSGIALPVRCYVVDGVNVGSCVYDDLCTVLRTVFNVNENNCPADLVANSIDCKCPFNLPKRYLDINESFDLPDASSSKVPWLASGDFDVTVKGTDSLGSVLCLNLKFTVKPK